MSQAFAQTPAPETAPPAQAEPSPPLVIAAPPAPPAESALPSQPEAAGTDESDTRADSYVPPPVIYTLPANAPPPVILVSLKPDAEALLRAARGPAETLFEALDHPEQRRVRHRESGVVCSFYPKTEVEIRIESSARFSCIEREDAKETNLNVERVNQGNVQASYADAINTMKAWNWARPVTELRGFAERNRSPEDLSVQITYPRERGLYFGFRGNGVTIVRIAVAEAPGGWMIRQQIVLDGPRYSARDFGRIAGQLDSEGEYDFAAMLGQMIWPALASRMQIVSAPQPASVETPEGE